MLRNIDGGQCLVGPPGGAGDEVFSRDSAEVELSQAQGWVVNVGLAPGGEAVWNALAQQCYIQAPQPTCPAGQLAIVLDDVVQSYPTVNEPQFSGTVSISGSFDEDSARSLARVLNRGAFPTQVEVRRVDTVSPTLGQDSLRASILAGVGGIVLLIVILVLFYRRLTLLIAAGMIVWGMLIYSVSVFISQTTNFALTLAGVTGIVVSIGMTVDSYVVYFERMKDEVLHGRTFRNSAARSFSSTWRTILAANLVSLIAAAVLFVLSVGSVRGFALYLGVTTICDVDRAVVLHPAGRHPAWPPPAVSTATTRSASVRPPNPSSARPVGVVRRDEHRDDRGDPARGDQPLAPADPGPDGDRLLGQAPHLDADLGDCCWPSPRSPSRPAAWCSASTSKAVWRGTSPPASSPSTTPARSSPTTASRATRPRSRSATPTAATSSRSRSRTSPRTSGCSCRRPSPPPPASTPPTSAWRR